MKYKRFFFNLRDSLLHMFITGDQLHNTSALIGILLEDHFPSLLKQLKKRKHLCNNHINLLCHIKYFFTDNPTFMYVIIINFHIFFSLNYQYKYHCRKVCCKFHVCVRLFIMYIRSEVLKHANFPLSQN